MPDDTTDPTPAAAAVPARGSRKPTKKAAKKAAKKKPVKLTAGQVVAAVRRHYGAERDGLGPEWAGLEEYALSPGGGWGRADLYLIRCWRSGPKRHERHVIEVKVSRADLRNELANPGKSAAVSGVSHRFYLAVPAGLVRDDDPIPAHWGIYEITERGTCRKTREAARNTDVDDLPEGAIVEAFRRAARAEARIRGADDDDPAAQVVSLTRQVTSLQRSLYTARAAADRHKRSHTSLLQAIAVAGGWLCLCGKPVDNSTGFARAHHDGTSCESTAYGYPTVDYGSIAVRLGLPDPTEGGHRDRPTPAELVERARRILATEPTGPADQTLAVLRTLLTAPHHDDPEPDPGTTVAGDADPDAELPVFFGPDGP